MLVLKSLPLVLGFAAVRLSAGEFINLGFDDPVIRNGLPSLYPGGPFVGDTSDLIRGWNFTANGQPVPTMTYSPAFFLQAGCP